jgi:hypothetical protein
MIRRNKEPSKCEFNIWTELHRDGEVRIPKLVFHITARIEAAVFENRVLRRMFEPRTNKQQKKAEEKCIIRILKMCILH